MALSRLDLAVVAITAAGLVWVEHSHRVVIGTLAADAPAPTAALCPETDNAPMSAACIKFIGGGAQPADPSRSRPVTQRASTILTAPDGY
jgi:hypothetical protein